MKSKHDTPDSPLLIFFRHLWEHAQTATGHSWTRLNGVLEECIDLAVRAGLVFDEGDIKRLSSEFRGGYWFHEGGPERWYAHAALYRNASAWKALEAYFGRKPFLWEGQRVHVGRQFLWDGHRVTVTSINDNGGYFVAVQHGAEEDERGYCTRITVKRRYKITHADLKAARKPKKKGQPT